METLSHYRLKALLASALILCLLPAGLQTQAQNKAQALADCQEALKSKLIEIKAERDGALLRARDDEEAVRVAANYRIRQQMLRENFVRDCMNDADPDFRKHKELVRALIDLAYVGQDGETGSQATVLLKAEPRLLQDEVDKLVLDSMKENSFDDAERAAFYELYLKGKAQTVTITNPPTTGRARSSRPLPEGFLSPREVTLTNAALLGVPVMNVYLETHPDALKELETNRPKRLEFFGYVVRKRAPLYAAALQKNLGVSVTADPHFAQAMALLPPAPIGRGTLTPEPTLLKQLADAVNGAAESAEKNHAVVELRHELYQRYGEASEIEFAGLITIAASVPYEAAQKSGESVNPFLARRLVDGWLIQAGQLKRTGTNDDEVEALKQKIKEAIKSAIHGQEHRAVGLVLAEAGFLSSSFRETLRENTGLDVIAIITNKPEAPVVLTPWQISTNAYGHPEKALKILDDNLGSLSEDNYKRQEVRRHLTHTPNNQPDYGAEMIMLVPKADRPGVAKYLLNSSAPADAALINEGLKAGLDASAACAKIVNTRGSISALRDRRAEAVVYYNAVLRDDALPMLDPDAAKRQPARQPRKTR